MNVNVIYVDKCDWWHDIDTIILLLLIALSTISVVKLFTMCDIKRVLYAFKHTQLFAHRGKFKVNDTVHKVK